MRDYNRFKYNTDNYFIMLLIKRYKKDIKHI